LSTKEALLAVGAIFGAILGTLIAGAIIAVGLTYAAYLLHTSLRIGFDLAFVIVVAPYIGFAAFILFCVSVQAMLFRFDKDIRIRDIARHPLLALKACRLRQRLDAEYRDLDVCLKICVLSGVYSATGTCRHLCEEHYTRIQRLENEIREIIKKMKR